MSRYVTQAKKTTLYWDEDAPLIPNIQVEVSRPEETGIFDHNGNPLYKLPDEIGFVASKRCTER